MAQLHYSSSSYRSPIHQRIMASMSVQVGWVDKESGDTIFVDGLTENLGETSALVNLEVLPSVGSEVKLRIFNEEETIIEVLAQVIRVERDPSKPLAALSISENLNDWRQTALTAAQEWAARHWQLNYEEEWVN